MKQLTRKKLWTASIAALLITAFIGGCKKDKFEEIEGVCPLVLFTDPADGSTGVPVDQVITATFNEKMDPSTITEFSFTVHGSVVKGTVSYHDLTATFTPTNPLAQDHTYTGRITTSVKDLMGNALQRDYVWTFSTGLVLSPVVISTDPVNLAISVLLNKTASATFSMPMNPLTINDSTFILMHGGTPVAGTVTYSDSTAYFTPEIEFLPNALYHATITTGAKSSEGFSLQNDHKWSFTTLSSTLPTVITTDPVHQATGVVLNKIISATFSVPMDPLSLNTGTFILSSGADPVAGIVSYSGSTVCFNPTVNLLPGTLYSATITTGTMNMAGFHLANNYTWTFTTGAITAPTIVSTSPVNLATAVQLNKIVTATFSEPMDPLTLTPGSFTLKSGATTVIGAISYSGLTASFNPGADLLPGTLYTATITNGVKNPAGISIANTYVWTFTTLSIPEIPTVISTDPLNNAVNVALNKIAGATFSELMDPLSMTSATFTLYQGTTSVTGVVSYSGKTAYFTPSVNLLPGTIYTATITTGAKSKSGTALQNNYVWTFTTGTIAAPRITLTDPKNNATGVALNQIVMATFSEAMDALTLNTMTYTIKQGTKTITGTVWLNGNSAYFKPNANLISNTTYMATISTGAKNKAGVSMANNYVWTFSTKAPLGPNSPVLNSVARFGIIAGTAVSNNAGFSKINNMDVGIYPGARSSLTGFPPAVVVNGAIYASDDVAPPGVAAMLLQAKNDLTAAYLYAEGATSPAPATVSGDQGGKTLAPGIYKSTSTLLIQSGDLTLDAQGDANAVWIFQVAAAFTTIGGAGGNVILSGGAQAKNIYWQVGSSATLGTYTKFNGNILALTSITMGAYATATGRMLARNAAVTMTSTNIINKP